ncbi:MAG: type II secretion system protein [Nitrospirae bacterium]|nr:type II secretion system protein [Nitrospirota bacterium]
MQIRDREKGFSLVELAIVMIIIGLLFALGLKMLGPLVNRLKHTDTKETINAAYEAVIGYAATHDKLPTVDEFKSIATTSKDVWGNDIIYRPADELTVDGTVCARSTTNLYVCDKDAGCDTGTDIDNVAFFILSRGANLNIQTDVFDVVDTSATSATIQTYSREYNNTDNSGIDDFSGSAEWPDPVGTRSEQYKDIVKWITLSDLRTKAGCLGAELKISTTSLNACDNNLPYSSTVFADGGIQFADSADAGTAPEYKWCREQSGDSGLIFTPDPLSVNCASESEAFYSQSDSIVISGRPNSAPDSYKLTFYVRDNNDPVLNGRDKIVNKSFVLSIAPDCTSQDVVNATGSNSRFKIDSGSCISWPDSDIMNISYGQTAQIYGESGCSGTPCDITYNDISAIDTNGDGITDMAAWTAGAPPTCTFVEH